MGATACMRRRGLDAQLGAGAHRTDERRVVLEAHGRSPWIAGAHRSHGPIARERLGEDRMKAAVQQPHRLQVTLVDAYAAAHSHGGHLENLQADQGIQAHGDQERLGIDGIGQ